MSANCGGGPGPQMGMTGQQLSAIREAIATAGQRGTIASSAPYFSRVFFTADATESPAGTFNYAVAQGTERRAFGYAKTDDVPGWPTSLGAAATHGKATSADTNLMTKGQTLAGQTVLIQGLACIVQPRSDFEFARNLLSEVSISIGLNGDNQQMEMGTPLNIPGIGGLYGWGFTGLIPPALSAAAGSEMAKLGSNGLPDANNYRRVPEGLIWRPAGKTDGTLVVRARVERGVAIGPVVERAAAVGIQVFDPPTQIVCDLMFHLVCIAISDQSVNF